MRLVNRATRAEKSKDAGIAMVVAIALMGIVAILVLALVSVALSEARGSGRDRQRSGAVMVAEGRVDTLVSQIQSAAPASLPCDDAATTDGGDVTVMSDDQDVSAVVTYYDAAGGAVDCANLASTVLTQAKVVVTSTSNQIVGTSAARRTVETLLELTPTYGNDLAKAIFGNAGVSVSNNGTVRTPDGALDADVYTNGDYICPNGSNQEYHGSIFAQGSITLAGSCTVLVDVHAGTFVNVSHNQADVNGRVLAAGGNALVQGDVGQQVRATGTASGGACRPRGADLLADIPLHQGIPTGGEDASVHISLVVTHIHEGPRVDIDQHRAGAGERDGTLREDRSVVFLVAAVRADVVPVGVDVGIERAVGRPNRAVVADAHAGVTENRVVEVVAVGGRQLEERLDGPPGRTGADDLVRGGRHDDLRLSQHGARQVRAVHRATGRVVVGHDGGDVLVVRHDGDVATVGRGGVVAREVRGGGRLDLRQEGVDPPFSDHHGTGALPVSARPTGLRQRDTHEGEDQDCDDAHQRDGHDHGDARVLALLGPSGPVHESHGV